MTALDDKFVPLAADRVEKYGRDAVFRVYDAESYDPISGKRIRAGRTEHDAKILPPESYESRYIDGETVRVGDMRTYVAAQDLAITPFEGMEVQVGGGDERWWTVLHVQPISPGEEIALYELQLRR